MNISTLEQDIKKEYGIVRAFIALHPMLSMLAGIVAAWATGHYIHFPA